MSYKGGPAWEVLVRDGLHYASPQAIYDAGRKDEATRCAAIVRARADTLAMEAAVALVYMAAVAQEIEG